MQPSTIHLDIDGTKELGIIACQSREGKGIHVAEIRKGTQSDGKLFPLDEILFIDSVPLSDKTVKEFSEIIKERSKSGDQFKMTIARPPKVMESSNAEKSSSSVEEPATSSAERPGMAGEEIKEGNVQENISNKVASELEPKSSRGQQGIKDVTFAPGPLGIIIIEDHGIRVKQIKHDSQCIGKMQEGDWILEINGTDVDNMTLSEFTSLVKKLIGQTYPAKILKWNRISPAIKASHKVSDESTQERGSSDQSNKEGNNEMKVTNRSVMEDIFEDWDRLGSAPSENTRNKLAAQRDTNTHANSNSPSPADFSITNTLPKPPAQDRREHSNANSDSSSSDDVATSTNVPNSQTHDSKAMPKESETLNLKSSRKTSFEINHKFCDICGKRDAYLGSMTLQQCSECGVMVHEGCYGLHNEEQGEQYSDWKCHACASVGKVIKLIKHDGEKKEIRIKKRPVHCSLCPISSGMHAMTPLYDTYGPRGQPIPAKAKNEEEGILWVHSLCALVIGSSVGTMGMVYGCYEDGLHIGGEESDNEDDDENDSVDKICSFDLDYYGKDGSPLLLALLHHFVMENECSVQLKRMEEFRELKCIFCKHIDQKSKRIPIQCAYDDCELALHIGCGKWGREQSRIEFFPGHQDKSGEFHELVSRGYCNKHFKIANKISQESLSENKKSMYYETVRETEQTASHSLKSGKDGDLFDDDSSFEDDNYVDYAPGDADEEALIRPSKDTLKRKISDSSRIPQSLSPQKKKMKNASRLGPKVSGKTSAYFEKKKRIQQYSLQMVQDLESRLKSGTSVRKAVKIVSSHWKNKLTESEFRMCRDKNDDDMNALIVQYRRMEEKQMQQASRKALVERDRKNSRWKHLFMPSFKFGATLTAEWDLEEEISPSDMDN